MRRRGRGTSALWRAMWVLLTIFFAGTLLFPATIPAQNPPSYQRPYGPNAAWNVPVAGLPRHPDSALYASRLWNNGSSTVGYFDLMFRQYTYPVYDATTATGVYPVTTQYSTNLNGKTMPWNSDWVPATGTDAQVIVLDPATGREWNLWQVSFDGSTVRATNGNLVQEGVYAGNGSNPGNYWTKENGFYSSRGCGIQYLAMLVRPEEIAQGEIRHALSMGIRCTDGDFYVAPATKLEHPDNPTGIPEGMRFALDITDAQIESWVNSLPSQISSTGRNSARIVARALRDYGMFVTDTAGNACLQFEDNATAGDEWAALGLGLQYINGKEYPRHLISGLITQSRLYAIVPSDQYPPPTGDSGSLRVTISPSEAISAGAQWRRVGTATWRNSDSTESNISTGSYAVEFKDLTGWTKPSNVAVTISNGQTTTVSGATATYAVQQGALQVIIEPSAAVSAGAQWRRVGSYTWRNSGSTESNILAGSYTVEFKDVTGWTKPSNVAVTISNGQTTTVSGAPATYAGQNGALQVVISPPAAVSAGAEWRRVGSYTWRSSGSTEASVPAGSYVVEFREITGWIKPSNVSVTIIGGQTTSVNGAQATYADQAGALQVTISPPDAVSAGAQWRRLGGTSWYNSGSTEAGIPAGSHAVEFKDLTGWTKPANVPVTVVGGQTTSLSGAQATYSQTPVTGSLRVTISPSDAVSAGAQWRRVGTATWRNSGDAENGLSPGSYAIEFKDVTGWIKPDNVSATIVAGETTTLGGTQTTYVVQTETGEGSLRVTLGPDDAVSAGAQWRRVETIPELDSGETETGIPAGSYTIEFKPISGWLRPPVVPVTITGGQTTIVDTAEASYSIDPWRAGSLRVTIKPLESVVAGALWKRTGTCTWHESGYTEVGVPSGSVTVEYKNTNGWYKPGDQTVTITLGETTTTIGYYAWARRGRFRVRIFPWSAVEAGAQWRRVGTSTWFDSDAIEEEVPPGEWAVEFKNILDWNTPPEYTVTIIEDELTTSEVFYHPQTSVKTWMEYR